MTNSNFAKLAVATMLFAGAVQVGTAAASAFWPGTVYNVPAGDELNIRKYPSAISQIRGTADNGDNLSMTGRCKNNTTGISFRIDGAGSLASKSIKIHKPNVWCQIGHEPGGNFELGWVRGKYVSLY